MLRIESDASNRTGQQLRVYLGHHLCKPFPPSIRLKTGVVRPEHKDWSSGSQIVGGFGRKRRLDGMSLRRSERKRQKEDVGIAQNLRQLILSNPRMDRDRRMVPAPCSLLLF